MRGLWAASSIYKTRLWLVTKFGNTAKSLLGKRTKVTICAIMAALLAWFGLPLTGNIFGIIFILAIVLEAFLILWTLGEDLAGIKFLTIPALPVFYLGSYLALAKSLELSGFGIFAAGLGLGISFYFLLLTQNIYNIAASRSIGLVRAAAVSGILFSVISAFLAYGVVWVQDPPFWILTPSIFFISFILFFLSIWSTKLAEIIDFETVKISVALSLALAQIGLALSFWPILPLIGALVLSISFYVILGLTQFEFQERLTRRVVAEYLTIASLALFLILVTTRWGG